jgi:hypothetical protein
MNRSSQAFAGDGVEYRDAEKRQADGDEKKIEHSNPIFLATDRDNHLGPIRIKDRDGKRDARIRIP